ncbi:MAG: hypothetical protein H6867_00250 [Rhodospirillales bacterium]|nr:hypothetical protein [Rhodospirillales bacterium]MCB9996910.1 hypothetical protein [Rhodospirillales bacterium]
MKKRILGICSRTTLVALEIFAVLAGLLLLVGGVFIWRLSSGPVDVGFAKDYVQQALHDPVNGYDVTLRDIMVSWPDFQGPLLLELDGVSLQQQGRSLLTIDNVYLGLSMGHLFVGQIKPVNIILTAPSVQLVRTEENDVRLSLEDDRPLMGPPAPKQENAAESDPLMEIIDILSRPEDQIDDRSPLGRLQTVEIKKARMVMEDYRLGVTWFLSPLDLVFVRDAKGLVVSASAALPGGRDLASHLQLDMVYSRDRRDFVANIHVQDFDPHILSRKIEELDFLNDQYAIVNGNIEVTLNDKLELQKTALSLSSVNGRLTLGDLYEQPLAFDELFLEASYDRAENKADVKQLGIKAGDVSINLSAPVSLGQDKFSVPVTIEIPELAQDKISPLWPDSLRDDGAEIWLTQKLSKGRFYDAKASFTVTAQQQEDSWEVDVKDITAGFSIENMDIDYRAPLAPIESASGKGVFENDTLTLTIDQAKLMDADIVRGKAEITKIIEGDGMAKIDIGLNGPLKTVLRYIGPEPIAVTEENLGLKIADVKGRAALDINVSFPTVRDLLAEQVKVKVNGTLNDVLLPDVVKTLDLTGGPFELDIAGGAAAIKGKGKLDGRDITFSWKEYLDTDGHDYISRVTADLSADAGLREKMGIGLQDWIDGTFPVTVTYTEYKGERSEVDVSANLTPGSLMIGPFKYTKAPGIKSHASCKVLMHNGYVQSVEKLHVETPELRMQNARFAFDTEKGEAILRRGSLPSFTLDENDLKIEFEIGKNDLMKIAVNGTFLDAQPFLDDEDKKEVYDGPPLVVSGSVDRMRTHPARMIDKAKFYLDMNKVGDVQRFEMDAVAGKGDIYLRIKPNERGVMSVRLEADDAGAAMRAFDMYENVKGGKLVLYGEAKSPQSPKIMFGNAELSDFYVVNAPVLARLVSAISLVGIQQLLGGDGIYFSRLESEFEWQISRKGDRYISREGRTSGSSLGLTFAGSIDKGQDRIKMEGTIVPVSMINELIGAIPLIGDILTGGGGGFIAATYKVEGPIKQPEVTVNPLSVLAPGILRQILFEGDSDDDDD